MWKALVKVVGGAVALTATLIGGWTLVRARPDRTSDYHQLASHFLRRFPNQVAKGAARHLGRRLSLINLIGAGILELEPRLSIYVDPEDLIGSRLLTEGAWEEEEWTWLTPYLTAGRVLVDVGAHIGTYSLRAAKAVGDSGRVLAIEPNPETAAWLRAGISASGWKNVTVVEAACGDARTRMRLFAAARRATGMTSMALSNAARSGANGTKFFDVDVIPLDEIFDAAGAARLDALKIDTEGAETMVLRGASRVISKYRPPILIEMNDSQLRALGSSLAQLEAVLRSYGYGKLRANGENALWTTSAVR